MAIWICIYNGFDKIPDLRQTGITKPGIFWQRFFPVNFLCALLIYLQKELHSYILWVFCIAPHIYKKNR